MKALNIVGGGNKLRSWEL